jgi:hypothetical protein
MGQGRITVAFGLPELYKVRKMSTTYVEIFLVGVESPRAYSVAKPVNFAPFFGRKLYEDKIYKAWIRFMDITFLLFSRPEIRS